ncbi:ankyrin [Lophiostoma macrostomum CBS 122681]|uniref:Ankyrin n=1 Tax=Lophiostoma macrostomum CBS 122681 TaxID=1314788 RepID=A0A6A6TFJ0_9PLEO|nr:ankyrin [Lophiostoma macrostomum CBS 122681]
MNASLVTEEETQHLSRCMQEFIDGARTVLQSINSTKKVPKELIQWPLFIPRKKLQMPFIMSYVRRAGLTDCLGRSPAHLALDIGYPETWTQVDPNSEDVLGRTALYFTARYGTPGPVEALLSRGADASHRSASGLTPLHVAAILNSLDICRLLWFRQDGCRNWSSFGDCTGRTPLHWAACAGNQDSVDFYCCYGSLTFSDSHSTFRDGAMVRRDVDNFGNSVTLLASQCRRFNIVMSLLHYRFAADIPNEMGRTPFWYAARYGDLGAIKALRKFTAIDRKDKNGRTPLAEAARQGFSDIVQYLLAQNVYDSRTGALVKLYVDRKSKDNQGRTPLHLAYDAKRVECVRVLRLRHVM